VSSKVKNFIYQASWYGIVRRFHSVDPIAKLGVDPSVYADRMIAQMDFADRYFGGFDAVILGDSNQESMAEFRDMIRYDSIVLNFAKSASKLQDWIYFFTVNPRGIQIYNRIRHPKYKKLTNLGGNDVIQNAFDGFEQAVAQWKRMLPDTWVVGIPPIDYDYMAQAVPFGPDKLKQQVIEANAIWNKAYPEHFIDVFAVFADRNGNVKEGVLHDPVHYHQIKQQMLIDEFFDKVI